MLAAFQIRCITTMQTKNISTGASLATTRSTPLPLNPQLGWFKMCTEKDYFHNCGHPTRNRTSRKETCTEAKHGLKCTPRKVAEYVHNSACPTCREIKYQQLL